LDVLRISRTYKTARRLNQIVNVFLKHGFGRIIDQIHLGRQIPFLKRLRAFGKWPEPKEPTVPERLRTAFAELGPTFIKLAQLLSTRPDLITARYAEEFRKLLDEVPSFPAEEAKSIITEETGRPIEDIFKEFDDRPVAAASIAQVHRAVLFNGDRVVVKVQRSGIKDQIETDIGILQTVAGLMEKHIPESKFINPSGIVEEFQKTVRKEMDFKAEARNSLRFKENFKDNPDVHFPRPYLELTSEKVLVMERIDGVRIDDIDGIEAMGLDRKELARIGVDAYLKMVFEDGFFHADPHSGNIFAMPSGQIGYTDFGIVGRVSEDLKQTMVSTFIALITQDYDRLVDQYIELGLAPEDVDLDVFKRDLKVDLADLLAPIYGLTLKEIDFSRYLEDIIHLAIQHNMRTPPELLLINKAFLILEDLGTRLDPDFDFMAAAEPYSTKLIKERTSPSRIIERITKEATEAGDALVVFPKNMKKIMLKVLRDDLRFRFTHEGLEQLIRDMDRSSNRIAFALVISAVILSSAIMHAAGVGFTVYGLSVLGIFTFGAAFFLGIWLVISILRSGRL
jgi:ubiquinone biosynthesis protein